MKTKVGILILVVGLFFLSGFFSVSASVPCTNFTYSNWSACNAGVQTRTILSSQPVNCSGGNSILRQNCTVASPSGNLTGTIGVNLSRVDRAFECLVSQLKEDCSGARTVKELSLSILASPNVTPACVTQLLRRNVSGGCFGDNNRCGIKETAMAILALDHVGRNTSQAVEWLARQNKSSSDVEWFLQQDSAEEVECKLNYDNSDFLFRAGVNKKLSGNVGPCFSFAHSNYWLRLNENCLDKQFVLTCSKEFFAGWHYKTSGSNVLNVLSGTKRAAANNEVRLAVDSKCFGSGPGCNFEESAWAVLALKNQHIEVKPFVPYLISSEDANQMFFPAAFNYLILEYSTLYGNKIIQQQRENQYWESEHSAYGRIYDTALALLAVGRQNQEQIRNAQNWVWNFSQETNGCWNSRNIRDTAFLLWAIEQRAAVLERGPGQITVTPTTGCGEAGFFCTRAIDCNAVGGNISRNYFCAGSLTVCCNRNPLRSCSEMGGRVCAANLTCSGTTSNSTTGTCCLSECISQPIAPPSVNRCKQANATNTCRVTCQTNEREVEQYPCPTNNQVCCAKSTEEASGLPLWAWILIGISILLIILAIAMKDRIKVWLYKRKQGPSPGISSQSSPFNPGFSRPGFPPLNRPMGRPMMPMQGQRPMQRAPMAPNANPLAQDTFAKLKEMTK